MEIRIRDEFIKLGQALKLADLVSDGVEAKYVINDGLVKVNGEVDTRRGRKVYRNSVPPLASSKAPRLSVVAPVKAPLVYPKNSDAATSLGMACLLYTSRCV